MVWMKLLYASHCTHMLFICQVMDKLLDKEVHQSYKAPSLVNYLSSAAKQTPAQLQPMAPAQPHPGCQPVSGPTRASELDEIPLTDQPPPEHPRSLGASGGACGEPHPPGQKQSPTTPSGSGARPKTTYTLRYGNRYAGIFCAVFEWILKKFPENDLLYRRYPNIFFSAVNQVFVLSATKK